jgi:hypothetical protein
MLTTMRGRLYNDPVKMKASISGCGSVSVHDGVLRGKSMPDYIGSFFPGLNYSNYKFKKMENHVFIVEGLAQNDMFFHGAPADVFVVGRTDSTGEIDYTMGVDLSGERRYRLLNPLLLRVPLMRYTGRIEDNQFEDQQLFFVPPHELAALLATQGTMRLLAKGPVDWKFLEQWHVPGAQPAGNVLKAMWVPGWFFSPQR